MKATSLSIAHFHFRNVKRFFIATTLWSSSVVLPPNMSGARASKTYWYRCENDSVVDSTEQNPIHVYNQDGARAKFPYPQNIRED